MLNSRRYFFLLNLHSIHVFLVPKLLPNADFIYCICILEDAIKQNVDNKWKIILNALQPQIKLSLKA